MGHGPRRIDSFHAQSDGIRFEGSDPDRQEELALHVLEDDDGHVRGGVEHQALDFHAELWRGVAHKTILGPQAPQVKK